MDKAFESRKRFIINFLYFGILVGAFYCLVNYALPYLFPFLFAGALAVVLQPPVRAISRKLKLKAHGVVSTILVLLLVTVVVCAIVSLAIALGRELRDFVVYLFSEFKSVDDVLARFQELVNGFLVKLPKGLGKTVMHYTDNFFEGIIPSEKKEVDLSALSGPLSGAWNVVKGIPSLVVSVIVTIISCVFMTSEYGLIRDMILNMCSQERAKSLVAAKNTVTRGVGKLIKAYITIMFITFAEVFIGLNLMKLIGVYDGGYIAIISFVTCVVDIVPVLGTGTVVLPWAIYSFLTGNIGFGIGLLIMYAVITVLRQAIEPKLVANQVGLPSIITIMAMFLGARLFGVLGVVLLPLTVIVIKLMYDEGIIGNKKSCTSAEETEVDNV